ncbi:MAG: GNAT family N-acetyltransferase [Burkholderiales bacterium]|nr:GNAT family N-acetyltransferase [Bacteroidia bacterium]
MIVEQYGLTYLRVTEQDLETLRYWRNQSFIRDTMQFKEYITPQMQRDWFNRINNKYNYYFIIKDNNKKIGLINCKDASPDTKLAEGGIFIWDNQYWGTSIPVFASLTMLQAVFEIFKSGEESIATVAKSNRVALRFNEMLGYEIKSMTEDGYYKLHLSREKYFSHCKKLIKAASIYNPANSKFIVHAKESDLLIDEINLYIKEHSTIF